MFNMITMRAVLFFCLALVVGLALIGYGIAIERYSVFPHDLLASVKRLVVRSLLVDTNPLTDCDSDGYCGLLDVGGRLTAGTWLDENRMYLADWEGNLRLIDVENNERNVVVSGLSVPQGLTVFDGRLYVSEMGNVCELIAEYGIEGDIAWCKPNNKGYDWKDLLSRSNARILSYAIDSDGGLSDRQTVIDRIVSRDHQHGPNGLVNDGEYIYVSIGHPQTSAKHGTGGFVEEMADEIKASGGRTELMGTVARFKPSAPDKIEVYARGFRNTYGISIGPDGTIYGADNDQPSRSGIPLKEEVNAIIEGGFYGFPFWGTNEAPPTANVIEPVAILQGGGSTFAYANADAVYVAYNSTGQGRGFVVDLFDYETFTATPFFSDNNHYITAILERDSLLYLVTFSGYLHIIDPSAAPITSRTKR